MPSQEEFDDVVNEREALADTCDDLEKDLEKAKDEIERLKDENNDLHNELDRLITGIKNLL